MSPDPFAPARLGPLALRNRIIKAATFEGVMPDGVVTDELVEYHRRVARGGAALSTVAYLAVAPEGRTASGCLWLHDEVVPGLRRLTDAIHGEGAAAAAQIGHAGPVADARSTGSPGPGAVVVVQPGDHAPHPGGHRAPTWTASATPTPGGRRWPWAPASTPSRSTWATTTC